MSTQQEIWPFTNISEIVSDISEQTTKDIQSIIHLFNIGQTLCEEPHKIVAWLNDEIPKMMQGRVTLELKSTQVKKNVHLSKTSITLPIQYRDRHYGTLYITKKDTDTNEPALAFPIAQLLAQVCSWLLYLIELSLFLQGQYQQLHYQIHGPLTRRERQVLFLMSKGYTQEAIAQKLHIATGTVHKHRQHIYEQLGVHCERDAILAAFHAGIISFLESDSNL